MLQHVWSYNFSGMTLSSYFYKEALTYELFFVVIYHKNGVSPVSTKQKTLCKDYAAVSDVIRPFSDFKAFLYILIGGFSVTKAANQNILKGFKVREGSDYL